MSNPIPNFQLFMCNIFTGDTKKPASPDIYKLISFIRFFKYRASQKCLIKDIASTWQVKKQKLIMKASSFTQDYGLGGWMKCAGTNDLQIKDIAEKLTSCLK